MVVDIRDVITCFKFGDDRFRGLASAECQILPFPIDFDGRPYNTLTLPCERVINNDQFRQRWPKLRSFVQLQRGNDVTNILSSSVGRGTLFASIRYVCSTPLNGVHIL